jgi:glycosyltransferase involved in cell wall biosynthesis
VCVRAAVRGARKVASPALRLAVYTDYNYRSDGDAVFAERAFALFLFALGEEFEEVVLLGRVDPTPGRSHYPVPAGIGFVALPHYETLSRPLAVVLPLARSLRSAWRVFGEVDVVWLLGPQPHPLAFALVAALRRRRVVLGVRHDAVEYTRRRYPGRRAMALAGRALDAAWRLLARRMPIVAVGPALAGAYRAHGARAVHELAVSLVRERDIAPAVRGAGHTVMSVGRLDHEKNPLMLADVLALLRARDDRWRLEVYGDGPLAAELAARLEERGLSAHAMLAGYVPMGPALRGAYARADMLLHVSWTEGMPQVIFEAFAAGLPVVATDVGGVAAGSSGAAALVGPGDPQAAADALQHVADDAAYRSALIERGVAVVRANTIEASIAGLARFLRDPAS